MSDMHDGCARCSTCGRHLDTTEIWPCLVCGRALCDLKECIVEHVAEPAC